MCLIGCGVGVVSDSRAVLGGVMGGVTVNNQVGIHLWKGSMKSSLQVIVIPTVL